MNADDQLWMRIVDDLRPTTGDLSRAEAELSELTPESRAALPTSAVAAAASAATATAPQPQRWLPRRWLAALLLAGVAIPPLAFLAPPVIFPTAIAPQLANTLQGHIAIARDPAVPTSRGVESARVLEEWAVYALRLLNRVIATGAGDDARHARELRSHLLGVLEGTAAPREEAPAGDYGKAYQAAEAAVAEAKPERHATLGALAELTEAGLAAIRIRATRTSNPKLRSELLDRVHDLLRHESPAAR